jgi:hypothetical protein
MSPETKTLATLASDVANEAADVNHFVPVSRLVELLGAEITARPLLVEGMLAAPIAGGRWLVLVDADSGKFVEEVYREERTGNSLHPRLRFTIAHELSHLIQYQSEPRSGKEERKKKTAKTMVRELEQEADKLSPLLLVAEGALAQFCDGPGRASLEDFIAARRNWGVSREVLVQRLNLVLEFDRLGLRYKPRLRDLVLGIGQWTNSKEVVLLDWPKAFRNLDDSLAPDFLLRMEAATDSLREAFPAADFCLNGGPKYCAEGKIWVGTSTWPRSEERPFRISVEEKASRTGKFLYLLERS